MMILLVDADAMTDLERAMSEEDLVTRAYGKSCFCNKMGGIICPPCAFRPFLSRALAEAHERGRQEGFKQALKEIELKRHGFLSVDQAHELAETIRTAMEGKDGE